MDDWPADRLEPEACERVHRWFACNRGPAPLDAGCGCAEAYGRLPLRQRQWLHTGVSDWSCCDD